MERDFAGTVGVFWWQALVSPELRGGRRLSRLPKIKLEGLSEASLHQLYVFPSVKVNLILQPFLLTSPLSSLFLELLLLKSQVVGMPLFSRRYHVFHLPRRLFELFLLHFALA